MILNPAGKTGFFLEQQTDKINSSQQQPDKNDDENRFGQSVHDGFKGTSNISNSNADGNRSLSMPTMAMKAMRNISSGSRSSLTNAILINSYIQCGGRPE